MILNSVLNSSQRRIADFDLVGNAAEEGLVGQVGRLQVRDEDDELLEGHLNLLAGGQRQEVVAVFQRNDPAIEQVGGRNPLPAEVVDQAGSRSCS